MNVAATGFIYYKPNELIDFYKQVGFTPSLDLLISTAIRYEYNADEIFEVCKALNIDDKTYRNIRNKVYDQLNPLQTALKKDKTLIDAERLDLAWQHIEQLHYRNDNFGFIIFATPRPDRYEGDIDTMWQLAINKRKLTRNIVAKLLTVSNLYIAVNTMKSYIRQNDETGNINCLYLDIDNVEDTEEFINRCLIDGRFERIEPSKIIASGGGLHFYFFLENAYNNSKLSPFLNRLQKKLHEIYPKADKLSDFARLLRLDGSTYRKAKKPLKTVSTVYESDVVYTVKDIGDAILPEYEPKPKKPKKADVLAIVPSEVQSKSKIVKTKNWSTQELARIRDFEYLLKIGHFDEDRRKTAVFLYGVTVLHYTKDFRQAAQAMIDFNMALSEPLKQSEMHKHISSVRKNGFKYNYSVKRLISELDIDSLSENDLDKLSELNLSKKRAAHAEKRNATKRESRRNKKSLTKRQASKEEKIVAIKTLLEQGLSSKEIAERLGISKRYVNNIIKDFL